ncbi:salicylate synthase [Kineosporia rhizophila]|uniref:salicylate synthase n=1 Tax=Kineosporia rhizophila TaxID=84633 RepID=UPI001E2D850E|nr:salicylate synthase [Kineosporia rhizophila]MCE0538015.1 salicylate synthase [Kineosporia rhizophila]
MSETLTSPAQAQASEEEVLETAVRMAAGGPLVVYQNGPVTRHAVGVRAELRFSAQRLTSSWAAPVSRPQLSDVARVLEACPYPQWRVFGWARFELALHRAGLQTGLEGDETLLHLIVPEVELIADRPDEPEEPSSPVSPVSPDLLAGADTYRSAVAQAVEEIRTTALDKVILSRAIELPPGIDLVATFRRGRRAVAAARSFHLDLGGWQATGFSPETVVEVAPDGQVSTQPLAGTRAFGLGPEKDAANRSELLSDLKEIAEHATSVRLALDEAEAICEEGSVHVGEFMRVLPRGAVQHLASRVRGRLRPGYGAWDAFGAFFPAVTASGIPKVAAYPAIQRLESTPRGLYSGAVIVADHTGALDAALVLRSVFTNEGRSWLRAGAGVVGASRPERELEETCEKLASVVPHLVLSPAPRR